MIEATLVYVFSRGKVLLGMKKTRFGKGRWNGLGGKVQDNETIIEAATREVKEEIGIDVALDKPLGTITFHNSSKGDWTVHIFATETFTGEPMESDEMRPQWFATDNVPYEAMWDDDRHWYPLLFKRQPFRAEFWFDENEKVVRHEVVAL